MIGINKTLFDGIRDEIHLLNDYDCEEGFLKEDIEIFLGLDADNYENRQNLALEISRLILQPHRKDKLPEIAFKLPSIERNLKDIQPHQRDHVCHSVLTFLLGFFMIIKLGLTRYDVIFKWKLAALLHDVGYTLEITDRINDDFFSAYERIALGQRGVFNPTVGNYLSEYLDLYNPPGSGQKRNVLDLIDKKLKEAHIQIDAKKVFNQMRMGETFDDENRRTDHGIASAILVLKAIDRKYELVNRCPNPPFGWGMENVDNQIAEVCSAIFVHNLSFKSLKWDFNDSTLATLLRTCDGLQAWSRPSANTPKGYSPADYDIKFQNGKIIFYASKEREIEIRKDLENIINAPLKIEELRTS